LGNSIARITHHKALCLRGELPQWEGSCMGMGFHVKDTAIREKLLLCALNKEKLPRWGRNCMEMGFHVKDTAIREKLGIMCIK
jgi:Cu/Ag efflux protein CusF